MRWERVKCKCAPEVCRILKCRVNFISRDRADVNILGTLFKPLSYIRYRLRAYYKHSNNEYRPMHADIRDDYCKSFPNRSSITPLGILLNIVGEHTNMNKPCPWPTGDYYIKDFNFLPKHLPSLIPEGRHMLNFTVYSEQNAVMCNAELYFSVSNYGILDLRIG